MEQIAHILQQIADNWLLVWMFTFFIGAILWTFRPGTREVHRDTSDIPFRHEDKPASEDAIGKEARP